MRFLLLISLTVILTSCENDEKSDLEFENLLNKQHEFAVNDWEMFESILDRARVESPFRGTLKGLYERSLVLDSLHETFLNQVEIELKSPTLDFNSIVKSYEHNMEQYKSAFDSFEGNLDQDENLILYNWDKLGFHSERIAILQMKLSLTMSHANYLRKVYEWVDGSCGWRFLDFDIIPTHTIDSNVINITLHSEGIKLSENKGNLILESITRNGQEIELDYNFIPNHSFTNLIIPANKKGNYLINGKVVYYTIKGRKEFPFKDTVKVN